MAKIYRRIVVVCAIFALFTHLSIYLSSPDAISLSPWFWIAGFAVAALPFYLSPESFNLVKRSPLPLWGYGFVLLSGTWLLVQGKTSEITWQEFRLRIFSSVLLSVMLVIFATPEARIWARRAIVAAVLFAVALNIFEMFNPMTFSNSQGRSAGLYVIATQSGEALVVGMILGIGALPHRYRLLFALIAGSGVLMTFSRGPLFGWLLAVAILFKTGQISAKRSLMIAGGCAVLVVLLTIVFWQPLMNKLLDFGMLNQDVATRMEGFVNPDQFGTDESSLRRREVVAYSWQLFKERPLLGHGVAASKEWDFYMGPHNQYLALMVDHGILGLFILPLLLLAVVWRARGEARHLGWAVGVFTIFEGWFSHTVLNDHYMILSFALLSSMAVGSRFETTGQIQIEKAERKIPTFRSGIPDVDGSNFEQLQNAWNPFSNSTHKFGVE
jgi:O-antigen ligase